MKQTIDQGTGTNHNPLSQVFLKYRFVSGVRVDTPDAEHMTALHLAVQRGLVEVITLLLEGGAKVNNKMNDKVLTFSHSLYSYLCSLFAFSMSSLVY